MLRKHLSPFALSLAITGQAQAASLTPPNLVAASSLNNPDLLLVWPYAAGGPLESMSWSVFKSQMASGLAGSFLVPSNNLSDLGNPTIARSNLGLPIGTSGAVVPLLNGTNAWGGEQTFPAATTASASINLVPGTMPNSPNNGDVWTTGSAFQAQVNGATLTVQQGSFSPTITFSTPGNLSVVYATQSGYYSRSGSACTAYVNIKFTPTFTTASGSLIVNSLPIPADMTNNINASAFGLLTSWGGLTGISGAIIAFNQLSSTSIYFSTTSNAFLTVNASNFSSGTQATLIFALVYKC